MVTPPDDDGGVGYARQAELGGQLAGVGTFTPPEQGSGQAVRGAADLVQAGGVGEQAIREAVLAAVGGRVRVDGAFEQAQPQRGDAHAERSAGVERGYPAAPLPAALRQGDRGISQPTPRGASRRRP